MIILSTFIGIFCLFTILVYWCWNYRPNAESDKYHGYIYDNDRPLANVKVIENWYKPARFTQTDSNGYFELEQKNVIGDLVFVKEGYKIDTVSSIIIQHGEHISYIFLNKKPDTIRLMKISHQPK